MNVPDPPAIVIVAPNWLGDAVMALPAIADVRRHFSSSRVVVAARRSVSGIFTIAPGVDDVIELRWRGRPRDLATFSQDAARLRSTGARIALLLPNSFAAAWLVRRAGIPERWGYAGDLRTPLLTRAVAKPRESLHQAAYYQHLLRQLGVPNGPLEACLTVTEDVLVRARQALTDAGWDGVRPTVVLAPGAAYGTAKQWLPEHFATLAGTLVADRAVQVVFVGSADDGAVVHVIRELMPQSTANRSIDLTGRTTLETLAGVLAHAQACVSNDSGAMHVAAAVGVPLAALFGPTNEKETAPLARAGVATSVVIHPVSCRPCMLRECPIDHPCMRDLSPARVLAAVDTLLAAPRAAGG